MIPAANLPADVLAAAGELAEGLAAQHGHVESVGLAGSIHTQLHITFYGSSWAATYDWVKTQDHEGFVPRRPGSIPKALLIAEVKELSPFGYIAAEGWAPQLARARAWGDMIAVHTEPEYGGNLNRVELAAGACDAPILAKGWHRTDRQIEDAFVAGATFALAVCRIPRRPIRMRCLLEVASLEELRKLPRGAMAVWNQRDLATGNPRTDETFDEAREAWTGWLCQASLTRVPMDVHPDADAVLVGEHLAGYVKALT